MMGRRENGRGQFFYSFDLDEVVHLIIRFAGCTRSWHLITRTRADLRLTRCLIIRMLLVGYVFAIRWSCPRGVYLGRAKPPGRASHSLIPTRDPIIKAGTSGPIPLGPVCKGQT